MKIRYFTLLLAASTSLVHAQRVPILGGQLQQQIPPVPLPERSDPGLDVQTTAKAPDTDPNGPTIRVHTLRITGQTLYDERTLLAASGVAPDRDLNLYQLRAAAARIAAFYKAHGYVLAQAYLPAQDVQGGSVTIAVI
ncbi:POTRA domain-containing protein [Sphingomonas sp. PAMC 26617]|uniref:POTRA domain-containing protein n=1 Tax=Sphingomonas sp. PAMC 26617 TaxID=1112216 RepID=UPI00030C910A|nr:POTRA domain-containing protein [Sphingomonas sp. PAMC 26617]